MLILFRGRVYNSDDVPMMVLFMPDELSEFRSQPEHVDIKCSYPPDWGKERGEKWMRENTSKLSDAKRKAERAHGNIAKTEIVSAGTPTEKMSDEEMKKLFEDLDPDNIEVLENEEGIENDG